MIAAPAHPGSRPARRSGRHRLFGPCLTAALLLALAAGCTRAVPPSRPPATGRPSATPSQPKPYKVLGEWYTPLPDARGFSERGIASWYGEDFHGKPTSSGEIYDMYGVSAAHKTLPLGTWVKVRNLDNQRDLTLRINDRGPFVRGRVIDLSQGAARELGVLGRGTAQVEIVALGAAPEGTRGTPTRFVPVDYYSGNFTFQVGAFKERDNAERLLAKLDRSYRNAHVVSWYNGRETLYRVRVGRSDSLEEASRFEALLVSTGFPDAFTIAE